MASWSAGGARLAMSASPPVWAPAGAVEAARSVPPATRAIPPLAPRERNSPRFSVVVMPSPNAASRAPDHAGRPPARGVASGARDGRELPGARQALDPRLAPPGGGGGADQARAARREAGAR